MLDSELKINQQLLRYCHMLVVEIGDERMAEQPMPGVNHPAWILGHLCFSADRGRSLLGHDKILPEEWTPRFGPGSKLTAVRGEYPAKEVLLNAVDVGFELLRRQAGNATPEQFAKPNPNPFSKDILHTTKDAVAFLLTGHLGVHLGQLSVWRRMQGIPALF